MDKDSNINVITTSYCSKTQLTIFSSFKTVYWALKSVKEPSIMGKYPILQICRTARLKIAWYIPKPETLCLCATLLYYYLLHLKNFSDFYSIFSLLSLIVTNDLRIWTPTTRWISRKSRTPVSILSGKVKLLKIIKRDSVINITRAYTEIFPNADKKKRHFLPTKDRYSSLRCIILKDKERCLKILRKTLLEFFPWIKIPI